MTALFKTIKGLTLYIRTYCTMYEKKLTCNVTAYNYLPTNRKRRKHF